MQAGFWGAYLLSPRRSRGSADPVFGRYRQGLKDAGTDHVYLAGVVAVILVIQIFPGIVGGGDHSRLPRPPLHLRHAQMEQGHLYALLEENSFDFQHGKDLRSNGIKLLLGHAFPSVQRSLRYSSW